MITTAKIEPGNIYQPPAFPWERRAFLLWQKNQTPLRRTLDEKRLAAIFREAQRAPVLTEALDWAHSHGIAFMIDRRANNGSGYYIPGTGVVALVDSRLKDMRKCVGTLTHEIRHAWQDYHEMLPTGGKSFSDYYMRLALCEADANAHQHLAEHQFYLAEDTSDMSYTTQAMERSINNASFFLLWGFKDWYSKRAADYGSVAYRHFGHALGIPGVMRTEHKLEYKPAHHVNGIPREGVDITSFERIQGLSRSFNGQHYFNTCEAREFLARTALSPDRAAQFFSGPAKDKHSPEINEIRRRQLLLKQHLGRDVMI